jgi:hypothetical protein
LAVRRSPISFGLVARLLFLLSLGARQRVVPPAVHAQADPAKLYPPRHQELGDGYEAAEMVRISLRMRSYRRRTP